MKKLIWIIPAAMICLAGCNTGDTPVETYKAEPTAEKTDEMSQNINANPNIPDAAKKAMGTK
jgi:hypothetical protein